MILTSFGMRKYTVSSATADTFSRVSCIVISLLMTVTVTVLVYALDICCRGVACVHANSVAINVPDPDDPDMDLVYRTESNVIHFRLSSPQRFVVAASQLLLPLG